MDNSVKPLILVIDDEKDFVHFVVMNLERSGKYRAVGTSDPCEGLQIASRQPVSLILLDIMMPEMDGAELAATLKEREHTRNIPIIFVTAILNTKEEKQNMNTQHEFLAKPVTSSELIRRIDLVLQRG